MSGVIIKFKVRSHGAVECMGLYVYTCSCCQVLLNNTVKVHQCTCMYFKPWPSFTVYLNQNLNQYSLCCESFFLILIQNIDPPSFFFIYREMLHSIFIPILSLLGRLKVRFVSEWIITTIMWPKILFQVFFFCPITSQREVGIWLPLLWFIYT